MSKSQKYTSYMEIKMDIKLFKNIAIPVNQDGMVIDPDLSLVVQNLTSGILTIRNDINPQGDSHIAIYGIKNEINNHDAIKYWVRQQLMNKKHTFVTLLIAFHHHHYDLEKEIYDLIH